MPHENAFGVYEYCFSMAAMVCSNSIVSGALAKVLIKSKASAVSAQRTECTRGAEDARDESSTTKACERPTTASNRRKRIDSRV